MEQRTKRQYSPFPWDMQVQRCFPLDCSTMDGWRHIATVFRRQDIQREADLGELYRCLKALSLADYEV